MRIRRDGELGRRGLAALAACGCMAVGGCADLSRAVSLSPSPVDPTSPIADQVAKAVRTDFRRPRFSEVPPAPTDVRPPGQWRKSVEETAQAGAALTARLAAEPIDLPSETQAFAEEQRASIPASEREAPPSDPAGTEAFAARLRAMAAPPPPPN